MNQNNKRLNNNFSDPETEKQIKEYNYSTAIVLKEYALKDARENKPKDMRHWKTRVYNLVEGNAKSAIDTMQHTLLPVSEAEARKNITDTAQIKTQRLSAESVELNIKAARCKEERKTLNSHWLKISTHWIVFCLGIVFGCFDGSLTYDSILGAGLGERQASLYGIVVAIAIAVGSHFGAAWAMWSRNGNIQKLRIAVQVLLFAMLFYWLGDLRAGLINSDVVINTQDAGIVSDHVSPFVIGGISLLIYFFSLCFSMFTYVSHAEYVQHKAYNNKAKELLQLEKKVQWIEDEVKSIEMNAQTELNRINQVCEYAVVQKRRIIDIARECLSLYANTNLNYRTDGLCPDFFCNPPQFNL